MSLFTSSQCHWNVREDCYDIISFSISRIVRSWLVGWTWILVTLSFLSSSQISAWNPMVMLNLLPLYRSDKIITTKQWLTVLLWKGDYLKTFHVENLNWFPNVVKLVHLLLELYTAVLPAVFSVSVFCRYQICWIFGISVGIVPPFFVYFPPFIPPFFPKGGWSS
jgi:hypothetical protein